MSGAVFYLGSHHATTRWWALGRSLLASADSMAWSAAARREGRDGNSTAEALIWRERLLAA